MPRREPDRDKLVRIWDWEDLPLPVAPVKTEKPTKLAKLIVKGGDAGVEFGDNFSRINDLAGIESFFEAAKITVAAMELFVRLGLTIMKARQLGHKAIELETLGRVFYLSIVLLLAIGLLVFPGSTAIILITLSSVALVSSVITLVKALFQKNQLYQKDKELPKAREEMNHIQDEARELLEQDDMDEINEKSSTLYQRFEEVDQRIQRLKSEKPKLEKKIGKLSVFKLLDRSLSTILCIVSVIGFALMLGLPLSPLGATLVLISTVTGLSYAAARLAYVAAFLVAPKIKAFASWITSNTTILDKSIAAISTISFAIGYPLLTVFPPVGIPMVVLGTVSAVTYGIARFTYTAALFIAPKLNNFESWILSKMASSNETLEETKPHESSAVVIRSLDPGLEHSLSRSNSFKIDDDEDDSDSDREEPVNEDSISDDEGEGERPISEEDEDSEDDNRNVLH